MEHKHKEAFMLMTYQCELYDCRWIEIIWNSRDGVTPFMGPNCQRCGGLTWHENWSDDAYSPNYQPKPGERIWRDGTLDMMRDIKRRMVERNPEFLTDEMKTEGIDIFIERIAVSEHESQPGWPALIEAHTGRVDGL